MVKQCQVCRKLDNLNPSLSFHRFPRDEDLKQTWLALLGLPKDKVLPKIAHICSNHFSINDFVVKEHKYLKPVAIPIPPQSTVLDSPEEISCVCVKTEKIVMPQENIPDQPELTMSINVAPVEHMPSVPEFVKIETIADLPTNYLPSNQNICLTDTTRIVNVETIKNLPLDLSSCRQQVKCKTEIPSDSAPTASDIRDFIIQSSSSSANLDPLREVETIQISSEASDSSTDTASETGDMTRVPPLGLAEPNPLTPPIKQETGPNESNLLRPEIEKPTQFPSSAQMRLNPLNPEVENEVRQTRSRGVKRQNPSTQQAQSDPPLSAESMTEEQLIEMLESDSPLLTPELLFCRGGRKTRKRFFGDIKEDDFRTPEEKEDFINTRKRIQEDQRKIKGLFQINRRLRSKLAKLNSMVSVVAGVCDVSHVKKVLEGEEDSELSSNDSGDSNDENTRDDINNDQTSNGGDPQHYEENETHINSFDLANQVQVTFTTGGDSANVDKLKKELKKKAGKDITKSKKIKQLNNTIFMKNKLIEDLKSELDKLKSVV